MTSTRILNVLRAPLVSEKTARVQADNQYVFEVAANANKADVKAAVEQLFNVKVESVQVLNVRGKSKTFKGRTGTRGGYRKAYVRVQAGQTIDVMATA